MPLAGELTAEAQDLAIRPSVPGRRKVVLATAIAETSLTIDGVRVVIDGGYTRRPRFDPASGMSRLETLRVSRAEAEQRRGRAGRVAEGSVSGCGPRRRPGHCQPSPRRRSRSTIRRRWHWSWRSGAWIRPQPWPSPIIRPRPPGRRPATCCDGWVPSTQKAG
ncbi:helicase-related protein [Tistrella bauzanensis]